MTMVASGQISLAGNVVRGGLNESVDIELGQTATTTISMNDSNARVLAAKVGSGTTISMSDFYGKSNTGPTINLTISVSTFTPYNIHTAAVAAYGGEIPANSIINLTINPGVIQGGTSSPSMQTGTFPNSGTTINFLSSGLVLGYGGQGGQGANPGAGGPGLPGTGLDGGDALWINSAVTCAFGSYTGYLGGGGGGGGGGAAQNDSGSNHAGGGGGGEGYGFGVRTGDVGNAPPGTPTGTAKFSRYGRSYFTGGTLSGAGGDAGHDTIAGQQGNGPVGVGLGVTGGNGATGVAGSGGSYGAGQGGAGGGAGATGGFGGNESGLGVSSFDRRGGNGGKSIVRSGGGAYTGSPTTYGTIV